MIYFLNDMPFSLAFGGKEMQLETYFSIVTGQPEINIEKLNFWNQNSIQSEAIFHLFGSAKWYHSIVSQIKSNHKARKIIINPNFYFNNNLKIRLAAKFARLSPLKNDFSFKEFIFNQADQLVVNSEAEGKLICDLFGSHLQNKITVIYNIIPDNFTQIGQPSDILEKINISPGYVLSVGLLDERKNSVNMIAAFIKSMSKHDKKLVILGKKRFVNLQNSEIVDQMLNSHKERIVYLEGIKPNSEEIKTIYQNCSFHFLPSHIETPGISNIEALAFGKRLLLGDCAPVKEYFKDYAIYCQSKSLDNITDSLIKMCKENDDDRSLERKQYVETNFLVSSIAHKVAKLYR